MREIKFRGKGFNNKWRYGFLLKSKNNIAISIPYSKTGIKNYFVDENTIGQYTGLKDKNGVVLNFKLL